MIGQPGRLLAVCVGSLFWSIAQLAAQPSAPPNWSALETGKIIVEQAKSARGTPGLRCELLVAGNENTLFDKLKNPDFFKASYSNIEKIKILRRYQNGAEVEFVLNAIVTKIHYVVARRFNRATYTVWWTKVSGDLKDIEGSWQLKPSPYKGKYLLVYESFVNPGVVPPGLYLSFAKRKAESSLQRLRMLLEQ